MLPCIDLHSSACSRGQTYNHKCKSDARQGTRIPQSRAPRVQEYDPMYVSSALIRAETALTEKVRLIVGTLWPATTNPQADYSLCCRRVLYFINIRNDSVLCPHRSADEARRTSSVKQLPKAGASKGDLTFTTYIHRLGRARSYPAL